MTSPQPEEMAAASAFWEIAKPFIPGLVAGALGGYLVTRWKTREDAVEKRLDELCQEVNRVAEFAAEYWQMASTDERLSLWQAKTVAAVARADGLRSLIAPLLSKVASNEIAVEASNFLREATGGEFGVQGRQRNLNQAQYVIQAAAAYTVTIRRSRMRDLSGWFRRR